ncbi:MAG: hypothetical protein ACOYIK_10885 [Coriobacteriales bacterium]|jgi:hypothetical protein
MSSSSCSDAKSEAPLSGRQQESNVAGMPADNRSNAGNGGSENPSNLAVESHSGSGFRYRAIGSWEESETLVPVIAEQIRNGDESNIGVALSHAGDLTPDEAVRLLDAAAEGGAKSTLEKLYGTFSEFEFEASALCHAITAGNSETAIWLAARGIRLCDGMKHVDVDGDTSALIAKRRKIYFEGNLSGGSYRQMSGAVFESNASNTRGIVYILCMTARSQETIEELIERSLVSANDALGLCLAAGSMGKIDLAEELAGVPGFDGASSCVEVERVDGMHQLECIADLLHPGCSESCAKFVCTYDPERVSRRWSSAFLKSSDGVLSQIVPLLRPEDVRNQKALAEELTKRGMRDLLEMVIGWGSKVDLHPALDAATANGDVELSSWILDQISKRGSDWKLDLTL